MAPATGHMFFDDESFEFGARIALGGAAYGLSEPGEVVATCGRIADGDPDSWFDGWSATATRLAAEADARMATGHRVGARGLYLRASAYLGTAFFHVLGTRDPGRGPATWREHRRLLARALDLWPTPAEAVEIPYEDTALVGWLMRPAGPAEPRATAILANGSDGPAVDMLGAGALDAVARGMNALIFDGPGQQHALYEQGLPFRHDWEAVVAPVVDWLAGRPEVDAGRIVLLGVSQAGYWVPRACAFEHRIAAAVADPGVVDVRASWEAQMPPGTMDAVAAGMREEIDSGMRQMLPALPPLVRGTFLKRMEPYRTDSLFDVLVELGRWRLDDVAGRIRCPLLVTDPDHEQFWPGQSERLAALVPDATLMRFTQEEGAAWHCEPMAQQLRNQRVFDWVEDALEGRLRPA